MEWEQDSWKGELNVSQIFYSSFLPIGTLVTKVLTVFYSLVHIHYLSLILTSTYEVILIIQTEKLLPNSFIF